MKPVYLDLHIHTSEDPNNLNQDYDIDLLVSKIKEFSKNSDFLISITDHNVINKKIYLEAKNKIENLILGVELHVKYDEDRSPFHCHIYFNLEEITDSIIDDINSKLEALYPNKVIEEDKNDKVPLLQIILNIFNEYDFILLPHAGQGHSTFNNSIPSGSRLDNIIEKSVYYNFFDGFTSRSNTGLEEVNKHFSNIGINDFVNLITCTDNYAPSNYPNTKSTRANPFIPTWMFAQPTFDGLRLSLSESRRLKYSNEKPEAWSVFIKSAQLHKQKIDVDINLTPGLNVVIGGSSSGKTLLVDSLYKKIKGDGSYSKYEVEYNVSNIVIDNPGGIVPHFIEQSFINNVVNDKDHINSIEDIDIIKKVFPGDVQLRKGVEVELNNFKEDLKKLINSVKLIEDAQKELEKIENIPNLVTADIPKENIIENLIPLDDITDKIDIDIYKFRELNGYIDKLDDFLSNNPFLAHDTSLTAGLKEEIKQAFISSEYEKEIRKIIEDKKDELSNDLKSENLETQSKNQEFKKLLKNIKQYTRNNIDFYSALDKISNYNFKCPSQKKVLMEHTLYIENNFILDADKFLEVVNCFLKPNSKITLFSEISPEKMFKKHFKDRPLVKDYDDFEDKVFNEFQRFNKKNYKIITKNGADYSKLSAGWKTAIILDLVLGYEDDFAPLIIDQPEDNLASDYINRGLVDAIKELKSKKQIIIVSHNATIPMIGDAQNIILCENDGNKISIRSGRLEGKIENKSVVDYIAEITDGGKSAIKKRIKKYNIKQYKQ